MLDRDQTAAAVSFLLGYLGINHGRVVGSGAGEPKRVVGHGGHVIRHG